MSKYHAVFTKESRKSLSGISGKIKIQILGKISALESVQYPAGSKVVVTRSTKDRTAFRIRSGDYRIIYSVDETTRTIYILNVGHRSSVYRETVVSTCKDSL